MKNGMYDQLAPFYAKLNRGVHYRKMATHLKSLFDRHFEEGVCDVLDLGCGTGNMTYPLFDLGYGMIGVDVSPDMLSAARSAKNGGKILWLCQDMRSFELYGTVEAVVCTLDGINHLLTSEDVAKCFSLVHNYLVPNGLFVFDINTPYKFKTVYGRECYILEDKNVFCAWQNHFHSKTGRCDFDITLFEQQDGMYMRTDTHQQEQMYSLQTISSLLADAGMEVISITDGYTDMPPTQTTERLLITARAKK